MFIEFIFRGAASQEVPVFACPPVRLSACLPVSLYEDDILPLRLLRGLESVRRTPTSVACLGFMVSNLHMQKNYDTVVVEAQRDIFCASTTTVS